MNKNYSHGHMLEKTLFIGVFIINFMTLTSFFKQYNVLSKVITIHVWNVISCYMKHVQMLLAENNMRYIPIYRLILKVVVNGYDD